MYFTEEPEHITMLRESMRRFVEHYLPRDQVRRWDKAGEAPLGVFHKLAETGVCGLTIAEEFGGAGVDLIAAIAVIEVNGHPASVVHHVIHRLLAGPAFSMDTRVDNKSRS